MVLNFELMNNILCSLWVTQYLRWRVQSCDDGHIPFTCDGVKVHLSTHREYIWMQLQEANSQES